MEQEVTDKQKGGGQAQFVQVSVVTTSGAYPRKGTESVPAHQPVQRFLDEAKRALHLTDTNDWVATVNGQPIDPNKSYVDNGLTGKVAIQWGPREGGGGC